MPEHCPNYPDCGACQAGNTGPHAPGCCEKTSLAGGCRHCKWALDRLIAEGRL